MTPATNLEILIEALWGIWRSIQSFFRNIGTFFKYAYRCVRYGKYGGA